MQIGDVYESAWGRYRVHRISDANVVLVDVGSPSASVTIAATDLEHGGRFYRDYVHVPAGRMPVSPQPQSSAGSAQNEPPATSPAGAPPFGRLVPDGGESFRALSPPPQYTLGALRPRGSLWSVPDVETFYWRPCIRPAEGDEGGPHCHFIASNLILSIYCPSCRPDRARIGDGDPVIEASPSPPTASTPEATPPWYPEDQPVWERVGGVRGANLREWWEERAAIIEEACHVDRGTAEREAYRMIAAKLAEHHGATAYTSATEPTPPPIQREMFR